MGENLSLKKYYTLDGGRLPNTQAATESNGKNVKKNTHSADSKPSFVPKIKAFEKVAPERRNIDVDSLVKQYKNEPSLIFDAIGIDFDDKQKAELNAYLGGDKKALKAFLILVQEEGLTKEDIIAGINKLKSQKPNGFFKRVGNFFKKIFQGDFSEAFKLAKSERLYHAQKLSENMGDIRKERPDSEKFSSKSVADIGQAMVDDPENKTNMMHFVSKKNAEGVHLYSEQNTVDAVNYIKENKENADTFTANAVELEAIETDDGHGRYNGTTIVNVSTRMTEKPDLRPTMMKAAKKSDMDNENLENITDNLFQNPDMQGAIEYTLNALTADGKDKFKASDISQESDYLVDKNAEFCNGYTSDLDKLSSNGNLTGSDIIKLNQLMNDNPDCRDEILSRAQNYSGEGENIIESCKNYVSSVRNGESPSQQSSVSENSGNISTSQNEKAASGSLNNENSTQIVTNQTSSQIQEKNKTADSPFAKKDKTSPNTVKINGESYDRGVVYEALYKKYGPYAEKVLQKIEDTKFVEMMKKYGNNKTILDALVNDPTIITRIRKVSPSLSNNEMADMIALCKNQQSTETLLGLSKILSPKQAIKYMTKAVRTNSVEEVMTIVQNNELGVDKKKEQISRITGCETFA